MHFSNFKRCRNDFFLFHLNLQKSWYSKISNYYELANDDVLQYLSRFHLCIYDKLLQSEK